MKIFEKSIDILFFLCYSNYAVDENNRQKQNAKRQMEDTMKYFTVLKDNVAVQEDNFLKCEFKKVLKDYSFEVVDGDYDSIDFVDAESGFIFATVERQAGSGVVEINVDWAYYYGMK